MVKMTKEVEKNIAKNEYYSHEQFLKDCNTYIEAVKSGRILYKVESVSKSGMSRKISITSFEGTMQKGYYRQYIAMLEALGYKVKDWTITINGCGMNMLFATNYNILHDFKRMNIITAEDCETLAQMVN